MTYEEAMAYIHGTLWQGSKLGLTRMRELLEKMGNPEKGLKFIHIAGTNGKGSTAVMLASVLKETGYRTGLFTSPYIERFSERIQVDGVPIADEALAESAAAIRPLADSMADHPTEFELVTAIGFAFFRRMKCDIVVLEVGLGGELDSTNIIDTPELAVITAIGKDHIRELGDSIPAIAQAKAGIIKAGGDVVIHGGDPEADAVFEAVCAERRARLHRARHGEVQLLARGSCGQRFSYRDWGTFTLSLAGDFQLGNAATAIWAVMVLREKGWRIPDAALRSGLEKARWPGRFEFLREAPAFILDGSHNPHGMRALARSLAALFPQKPIVFLVGVMADKDIPGLFTPLIPLAARFITVRPDNPRAVGAVELAVFLEELGVAAKAAPSLQEGVRLALTAAGPEGIVCAAGSLYMAGAIRRYVLLRC